MPRTKKKVKPIVKTKVISARVTEAVYELLHQQAEDAGMTLSEFTAQMLMKGRVNTSYVFYVHPDEIEAMLRMTQQEVADRANITLRQYQRLESGERNILTSSFGLACRVIEALDMDVSKFYHGDYYLEEEVKTMRGKGIASRKKSSI